MFVISIYIIEVKGPERGNCSFQLPQTGMLTLSAESANVCVTRTRGYLKLAGWPNTAWIRRRVPGKNQAKFSSLCTPCVRFIIYYDTLLYVLRV